MGKRTDKVQALEHEGEGACRPHRQARGRTRAYWGRGCRGRGQRRPSSWRKAAGRRFGKRPTRRRQLYAAGQEDLKKWREGITLLAGEKAKAAAKIREELLAAYRPRYEELLKEVYKALKQAAASERRMEALWGQAHKEAVEFLPQGLGSSLAPFGRGIVETSLTEAYFEDFRKRAALNGFRID